MTFPGRLRPPRAAIVTPDSAFERTRQFVASSSARLGGGPLNSDVSPLLSHSVKNVIVLAILIGLGWVAYGKYQERALARAADTGTTQSVPLMPDSASTGASFKCDGRIYCSQMTSCAEATYFLRHCPGTKMDGDNDGIPCEKQHCR